MSIDHSNRFLRVPFGLPPNISGFLSGFPFRASPNFRASLFGLPQNFGLPLSGFINNISEIADWYYNVRTLFYTYDNFYSPFNLWVLDHYWPHELRFWLGVFPPVTKKKTKSFVVFLLLLPLPLPLFNSTLPLHTFHVWVTNPQIKNSFKIVLSMFRDPVNMMKSRNFRWDFGKPEISGFLKISGFPIISGFPFRDSLFGKPESEASENGYRA